MKTSKKILQIQAAMVWLLILIWLLAGCGDSGRTSYRYERPQQRTTQNTTNYDTTAVQKQAADGFDLQAATELVKKVKDAEEFEERLNTPNGINNLDLNSDGKVDYIKVTEYGSEDLRGFSLTVELEPEEVQEIATIELEKREQNVEVVTYGNQHIYGHNYGYRRSFGLTDMLILGWMFNASRPAYTSPYGYGRYPGHYRGGYSALPQNQYRDRVRRTVDSTSYQRMSTSTRTAKLSSPNANKNSAKIKAPLRNPSTSQKSFQARMKSTAPRTTSRSGGFGNRTTSTASKSTTPRTPSASRSTPSASRSTPSASRSTPSASRSTTKTTSAPRTTSSQKKTSSSRSGGFGRSTSSSRSTPTVRRSSFSRSRSGGK
jgi:hypothetical protein